jgi:cytoskeletal protein RodZ
MLERLNRNRLSNRVHWGNVFVLLFFTIVIIGIGAISFSLFTNAQQTNQSPTLNQPSSANILITSWNENQTKSNNYILSDIKVTGSKIVNGTISSGTTITTTRIDFLSHLSNKTVVYTSLTDKITLKTTANPYGQEITLARPLKCSAIVNGVTYSIKVDIYPLTKLRNKDLIYIIWINDYYWWGGA